MASGDIAIRITADDLASATLDRIQGHARGLQSAFSQAVSTAAGFAIAIPLLSALQSGVSAVGGAFFGLNSQLEQAKIGFTTMIGSAQQADALLRDLQKFAQTTPFEFPDLLRATTKFISVGVAARDVIPVMTAVGDAVAAVGGSTVQIDRVALAFQQMAAKGRVQGQELLQIAETGIPIYGLLAKELGVTTAAFSKMVENGAVPADVAFKAFVNGVKNSNMAGMMQQQSATFQGAMSNIKDAVSQASATAFRPFFAMISEGAQTLGTFLQSDRFTRWVAVVTAATQAVAGALRSLFSGDFDTFIAKIQAMGSQIAGALLHVANQAVPVLFQAISAMAEWASSALVWGFNLAASFGQGIIEGAATAVVAAVQAVGQMIAGFLQSFSPPKKGVLSQIDTWGANLINTYLDGMKGADFGLLDTITKSIRDALTVAMNAGDFGEEGMIPRLLGSQGAVVQALSELRQFGSVAESTFSLLRETVGRSGDAVVELFQNLVKLRDIDEQISGVEKAMRDLDRQTREVQRQVRAVEGAYRDLIKPLDREIGQWTRYYRTMIDGLDSVISRLQRTISLRERELGVPRAQADALDQDVARNQIAATRADLAEAENAHTERAAKIREQILDKDREIARAQADIARIQRDGQRDLAGASDPKQRLTIQERLNEQTQRAQERIGELTRDRLQLENRAAQEGRQTDQDRLRIAQLRRDLAQQEAQLRQMTDAELAAQRTALELARDRKDAVEQERDTVLGPLQRAYNDLKDAQEAALEPLKDLLDSLADQRTTLQDQLTDLQDQRTEIQGLISDTQSRLAFEAQVSEQLERQRDLLGRMAEEAAGGAGGKGGAGAGALAGLGGSLANLNLGADLKTKLDELKTEIGKFDPSAEMAKLGQTLKTELKKALTDAFGGLGGGEGGAAAAGGVAGFIASFFLPVGPVVGAVLGAALGVAIYRGIEAIKERWGERIGEVYDTISGWVESLKPFASEVAAPFIDAGQQIVDWTRENWPLIQQTADTVMTAIAALVKVTVNTIQVAWEALKPIVTAVWDEIKLTVHTTIQLILGIIKTTMLLINGDWSGALKEMGDTWGTVWKFIKDTVHNAFHLAGGIIGIIKDAMVEAIKPIKEIAKDIGDLTGTLVQKGKDLISGLIAGITSRAQDVINAVSSVIPGPIKNLFGGKSLAQGGKNTIFAGLIDDIRELGNDFEDLLTTAIEFEDVLTSTAPPMAALADAAKDFKSEIAEAVAWFQKFGYDRPYTGPGAPPDARPAGGGSGGGGRESMASLGGDPSHLFTPNDFESLAWWWKNQEEERKRLQKLQGEMWDAQRRASGWRALADSLSGALWADSIAGGYPTDTISTFNLVLDGDVISSFVLKRLGRDLELRGVGVR